MKNYINRSLSYFSITALLLFPSFLLSSQIQFSRDAFIIREGAKPIFSLEVNLTDQRTGKNLYEGIFKRNQIGEIFSINNGTYLLTVNHQSLLRSRAKSGGNQYLLSLDDEFIKIKLGKRIDISSPNISLQKRSFSYGISNINTQKLYPSTELKIAEKKPVFQNTPSKIVSNTKKIKKTESVDLSKNQPTIKLTSKELNIHTKKLINDFNASSITFNEAIESLNELKSKKLINDKEYTVSKNQLIKIYLNN
jgi:hypothetical protein